MPGVALLPPENQCSLKQRYSYAFFMQNLYVRIFIPAAAELCWGCEDMPDDTMLMPEDQISSNIHILNTAN